MNSPTAKIKAVPGKEGHVWIPGSTTGLSYTTDGGNTINKVSSTTRCDVVGFGKAKDGADYLSIYMCGQTDGLYAVYRSDDMAKSWVRVNDDQHQYGSINYSITGDLRVYGRVFVATNGRGIVYGEPSGSEPPITTYELGDINKDGNINAIDFAALKVYLLGTATLTEEQMVLADVNKDGSVNAIDFAALKSYLLGITTSFK